MTVTLSEFSVAELRYAEIQIEKSLKFDLRAKWESFKPSADKLFKTIAHEQIEVSIIDEVREDYAVLYWVNDCLVLLDLDKKNILAAVASSDKVAADKVIADLKEIFPPEPDVVDGKVKVRFWYNTNNGPRNVVRTISVPDWKSIKKNYEDKTLTDLQYLIEDFRAKSGGQLIIMSGLPGTGKSYYLRSLLHSWRDWCTAEYVLDPENLFGHAQGYMADVVLRDSYDEEYETFGDEEGKWKLLILEDSGELLVPDAKDRVGQGLSRLLNLVDGLIGQGLRVLVLITTNEEFDKLHSAVARDGRCAAAIQFNTFDREKAEQWMNGSAPKLPDNKEKFTLAELYALTKGTTVKKLEKESASFGFRIR